MLHGQGFLVYVDLAQAIPKHPKILPATAPPAPPSSHRMGGNGNAPNVIVKTRRGGKKKDDGDGSRSNNGSNFAVRPPPLLLLLCNIYTTKYTLNTHSHMHNYRTGFGSPMISLSMLNLILHAEPIKTLFC